MLLPLKCVSHVIFRHCWREFSTDALQIPNKRLADRRPECLPSRVGDQRPRWRPSPRSADLYRPATESFRATLAFLALHSGVPISNRPPRGPFTVDKGQLLL